MIQKEKEKGSILVIALVMLALLSALGVMSLRTTNIELQIARNERIHVQNFNLAEGACMQAVQTVADKNINFNNVYLYSWIRLGYSFWLNNGWVGSWYPYLNTDNWFRRPFSYYVQQSPIDPNAYYVIQYDGMFEKDDDEDKEEKYNDEDRVDKFICYGLYKNESRGEVLIEVGVSIAHANLPNHHHTWWRWSGRDHNPNPERSDIPTQMIYWIQR